MRQTGISVAWLADETNTQAQTTLPRVWAALRSKPTWQKWLHDNVPPDLFIVVNFEDRDKRRKLLKNDSLTYYVPFTEVKAAAEARNLPNYAAEIYRDVYTAWAEKHHRPPPPPIDDTDLSRVVPSRLP